jgi:DNA-directed RNA polymerase subunit RPC12/RpoP
MSVGEWKPIPPGLLKMTMTSGSFGRLKYEVQVLISQLAEDQGYKCALCSQNHSLEIEHDHDPEYGTGEVPTIYNIRGLACRSCNWHIMMYERNNNGEYISFGEASSRLSDYDWEKYTYAYQCRVDALNEERIEKEMGFRNYWRRKGFLRKFDEWREWGGSYPWYWGFDEIRDQKYGKIRTPKQFLVALKACLRFLKEQLDKDPDYEIPEQLIKLLVRIKPMLDELLPIVEARLTELRSKNEAVGPAAAIATA